MWLLLSIVFSFTLADQITCPAITCDDSLDVNICYKSDTFQSPVQLKGNQCNSGQQCMFTLDPQNSNNQYAWIWEPFMSLSSGTPD